MKQYKSFFLVWLGLLGASAQATDLADVWRGVKSHDPEVAVALAARQAGEARRAQGAALWRPSVTLGANAGRMSANSDTRGAYFSAPGFGQTNGVAFNTSINNGNASGWALGVRQPLISQERDARSSQLAVSADLAEIQWEAARSELMLQTAQRYFDVVLAEKKLELVRKQSVAVKKTLAEAKDRFSIGDAPITDTYEASASEQALEAQLLLAQNDLQMAESVLRDATGMTGSALDLLAPADNAAPLEVPSLPYWQALAGDNNPKLRLQQANVQLAKQETRSLGAAASATLDLVAQANQLRISGSGEFGAASNNVRQQQIGLQLNIPLFTGGYRSARQSEALRLEDKAIAEVERTRQQIQQQTQAAWLGLNAGRARIAALKAAQTASLARLDATRLGRELGDRTTLNLLTAENDSSSAELALLQARIDILMNQLRLQALTGRLDESHVNLVNSQLSPAGRSGN